MPFPILGGKSITAEEDVVTNSCCFVDGDAAYMEITPGSDGNRRIFTFSCWFKRGVLGTAQTLFSAGSSEHNVATINFNTVDRLGFWEYDGDTDYSILTTRKLRDPAAWYHVVCTLDTTQGTEANRAKIYINGVQETVLTTDTYPSENYQGLVNTQIAHRVGKYGWTGAATWDGYMAEVVFIDGTAYAASDFGEFDENSPNVWIPKDVSGLTFGTNGFYLDFEASGNLGNDANGGTDLTEYNLAATDQCTDTPNNNFCTLNPIVRQIVEETSGDLSEGSTEVLFAGGTWGGVTSTMAAAAGKWYFEGKLIANGSYSIIGVVPANTQGKDNTATWYLGQYTGEQAYQNNGAAANGGASFGDTYTDDDIIGVALDCDNAKVYFSKNGTFQNSGDPSSGATGTGAMSLTASLMPYTPAVSGNGATNWEMNFGNPSYANSSDAADGNGYGAFEYAPPSGYLALCTKNLGSDGG